MCLSLSLSSERSFLKNDEEDFQGTPVLCVTKCTLTTGRLKKFGTKRKGKIRLSAHLSLSPARVNKIDDGMVKTFLPV